MKTSIPESNFLQLLKKEHEGKWVAFSPNYEKIVGYANRLQSLAQKVGTTHVVYFKVPPLHTHYAFSL